MRATKAQREFSAPKARPLSKAFVPCIAYSHCLSASLHDNTSAIISNVELCSRCTHAFDHRQHALCINYQITSFLMSWHAAGIALTVIAKCKTAHNCNRTSLVFCIYSFTVPSSAHQHWRIMHSCNVQCRRTTLSGRRTGMHMPSCC